jgi:hypothetical protein
MLRQNHAPAGEPPLRADTHGIADQHPHHQSWINRGATGGAVERLQQRSNPVQFEMSVNPAQQVICRNVIIKAEVLEELQLPDIHHHSILRKSTRRLNHDNAAPTTSNFSTASAHRRRDAGAEAMSAFRQARRQPL